MFNPIASLRNFFTGGRRDAGQSGRPALATGLIADLRNRGTAYPGPQQLNGHYREEREVYHEKIRTGPQDLILPAFLPYLQNITQETAAMRTAYGRIAEENPYVKAGLDRRVNGVSALDVTFLPADVPKLHREDQKRITRFIEWQLTQAHSGGIAAFVEALLRPALTFGVSVCDQQLLSVDEGEWYGKIICRKLKIKQYGTEFVFDIDDYNNVVGMLGLQYNAGAQFTPGGFAIYTNREAAVLGLPMGSSELRSVYSPAWYWDTTQKLRGIFLQIAAQPIATATIGQQAAPQTAAVQNSLAAMLKRKWVTVPEGVILDVLNIAGGADAAFATAIEGYERDIMTGLTGSSLQALQGSKDSQRGNSAVHQEDADLPVWRDAQAINAYFNDPFNGFVRNICGMNFVAPAWPKVQFAGVDLEKQKQEMELDTGLKNLGYDQDATEVGERYNRKLIKKVEPVGGALPPGMGPDGKPQVGKASPDALPKEADPNAAKAPAAPKAPGEKQAFAEHDVSDEKRDASGKWTAGGKTAKGHADDLKHLSNAGLHPDITNDHISLIIHKKIAALSSAQAKELAKEFGIRRPLKNKEEITTAIRQAIQGRKGSFERGFLDSGGKVAHKIKADAESIPGVKEAVAHIKSLLAADSHESFSELAAHDAMLEAEYGPEAMAAIVEASHQLVESGVV